MLRLPCLEPAFSDGRAGARYQGGLLKGGARGPEIVAGKPDESRLLQAIRYGDPKLQMPPTGKLPDAVTADFENLDRGAARRILAPMTRP